MVAGENYHLPPDVCCVSHKGDAMRREKIPVPAHSQPLTEMPLNLRFKIDFLKVALIGWSCHPITTAPTPLWLFPNMLSLNLNVRWAGFSPGGNITASLSCSVVTHIPPRLTPLVTLARVLIVSHIQSCNRRHRQLNTYDVWTPPELASLRWADFSDNRICRTDDLIPRGGWYR